MGFNEIPGGVILFWAYQILAVLMLAAASMTALQDAQATEWRDVAIGEIPEAIVYRDPRGTFTRSVTITFGVAVIIMLLVRGHTTLAVPFYGVGVFMPITAMGLAVRKHVLEHFTGRARLWGSLGATFVTTLAATVFLGQLIGTWHEGGWMALISFLLLATAAHLVLLSPAGFREARQVHRIVHDKARVQGAMASIVKWQAFKMQEYRFQLMIGLAGFLELFGLASRQGSLHLRLQTADCHTSLSSNLKPWFHLQSGSMLERLPALKSPDLARKQVWPLQLITNCRRASFDIASSCRSTESIKAH
jgi:hypothetical protein